MKRRLLLSFTVLTIAVTLCPHSAEAKKASGKSGGSSSDAAAAATSAPAAKDSAPEVVQQLEQRLFFKTYPSDDVPTRLARIEKQIFGQAIESSQEDRLARLDEVLRNKLEAERKIKEAEEYRNATMGGAAPSAAAPASQTRKTNPQDDLERARLQIQAAREEEIAGLLEQGVNLFRQKQGMQAQDRFEQVLRLDPHNAQAHFNLGIIEESMGNFVEALASYRQALAGEPGNREYSEAVAAIEKKAGAQARSIGARADLRALAEQANAAWKRGEYISALDLYQQLDAKEPNRALVKYNIGSIYLMLKDPDSALNFYKQAAKLEPHEAKYTKAASDLASELKKNQREEMQVQQEAQKDWQEAHKQPAEPKQPKQPKVSKVTKSTKQQPAFFGSNFAPYAVLGGNPTAPAQPRAQTQNNGQYAQAPYGQPQQSYGQPAVGADLPVRPQGYGQPQFPQGRQPQQMGRPGFGVAPNMVGGFTGAPQQQYARPNPTPDQQMGSDIMAQFGIMGKSNGQGVTVVTVGIASRAASAGMMAGDDIKAVDGYQVSNSNELADTLTRVNRAQRIPFLIMRNGNLTLLNL